MGKTIIPVNCSTIIHSAGAIHCIVMHVPAYSDPIPSVRVLSPRPDATTQGSLRRPLEADEHTTLLLDFAEPVLRDTGDGATRVEAPGFAATRKVTVLR